MQRFEVSDTVRHIYWSLGVKGITQAIFIFKFWCLCYFSYYYVYCTRKNQEITLYVISLLAVVSVDWDFVLNFSDSSQRTSTDCVCFDG